MLVGQDFGGRWCIVEIEISDGVLRRLPPRSSVNPRGDEILGIALDGAGEFVFLTNTLGREIERHGLLRGPMFRRGDGNDDGTFDIADAVAILSYLFAGGVVPCIDAADANDDGAIDIADAIAILSHLFGGAGDLPPPFGSCGVDPTPDDLAEPCIYAECDERIGR